MGMRSKVLKTHMAESKEPRVVSGQGEIREDSQARLNATGRPPSREERAPSPELV